MSEDPYPCAIEPRQGPLVLEVPSDGLRCKTLVVTCMPAEKRKGKHAPNAAVLVVLLVERRLSIPKLKSGNPALGKLAGSSDSAAQKSKGCKFAKIKFDIIKYQERHSANSS